MSGNSLRIRAYVASIIYAAGQIQKAMETGQPMEKYAEDLADLDGEIWYIADHLEMDRSEEQD